MEARQFPQQLLRLLCHYKDISFMKASVRLENLLAKSIPQQPNAACFPLFCLSPVARFVLGVLGSPPHVKTGAQVSVFSCSFHLRSSAPSSTLSVLAMLWTGCSLQGRVETGFPVNFHICAFLLTVTVFKHFNKEYIFFLKLLGTLLHEYIS